jgi:hypothetical protein
MIRLFQKNFKKRTISSILIGLILTLLLMIYFNSYIKRNNSSSLIKPKSFNQINLKIVIPFHINQLEILLENIKKWNIFKPCNLTIDNSIEITFYVGYLESDLNQLNKLPTKMACFSKISQVLHKYKSLNEDKHVIGSRLMFESMLLKATNYFMNSSFIFYMEPDVIPIKSNWLNAILNEIGNGNFWCKGSIFRGDLNKFQKNDPYIPNYLHINGNAIYNTGNIEFISFYFNILRPYIVKKNGDSINAYDTDIFEYLMDKNNYETTRNILHQFHFTDLVQNYWHTEFKVNEISLKNKFTYFIHGGKPIY